jgi:regulator of sirC expression with transglutaminase-like and TPR domain
VDATERFAELVRGPEAALPLDEAALCIAAHAAPGLDVPAQLDRLDDLADQVGAPTLDGLRRLLFRDLGFSGNGVDYYDPRNSYLHEVLDRRTGIPISLAVLMMEVGRRIGVPLSGVSMPGHFLVRDKVDPDVFVDPFARGAVIDRQGCRVRFHAVHGPRAAFQESFLEPVGRHTIVTRMLANLEGIAGQRADRPMLAWVRRLRAAMPDAGVVEQRRLAAALAASGQIVQAAETLEEAAAVADDQAVAQEVEQEARALRAKLN